MTKNKKDSIKPPDKRYYDVRVTTMLPATITYKVLAETPEEAAELIKGKSPNSIVHKLIGKKDLELKVYDSGGNMIRFIKKLFK